MFRYINFQVLPVDSDDEIGSEGYSKIMLALKARKDDIFRERRLQEVAAVLRNDMFFYVYSVHEESGCFYGHFLKYDLAEQVENIYTGEVEFNGGNGSSTHRFYFNYVFDFERHIFAIEEAGGRLPSAKELEKAIVHVFSPIVDELFPECVVEAVVLSEAGKLYEVFEKADGFYAAEVNVTYSNNRFALKKIKKVNQKLDQELKDKRIGQVDHKERSHSGGTMNALSDFCMACLSLSGALGDAKISFFNKDDGKRENFFLKNFPVRIRVSRLKSMVDSVYRLAIKRSIMRALERAGMINKRDGG